MDRALNIHLGYWNPEDGEEALRLLDMIRDAALAMEAWDDQLQSLHDAYRHAIENESYETQYIHSSAHSMLYQEYAYLMAFLVEWALDGWATRAHIDIS